MRIAAYVHMTRTLINRGPTGVAKHINQMIPRLSKMPGVELEVVAAAEDLDRGAIPTDSALLGLPIRPINWSRRIVEMSWSIFNRPKLERWAGAIDWVYCPAEAYVATKRAKRAFTVHCVNWFEKELTWYDDADTAKDRRSLLPRFRRFRSDSELILPVSHFLASRLTALFGIEPERMRIVGNGVEESYFHAGELPEKYRYLSGVPFVIVVGGLTRRKGGDCILDVAAELSRRNSDTRILIAGRGESQFDSRAASCKNIETLGYVGVDTGLPALLNASTAMLFPSRYETFGIPAVEAMAAGTPAIVSHFAGLPEVVGDAGIIVDPAQPAAIAEIIDNLAKDPAMRQSYVERGRVRAEAFTWDSCAQRVIAAMQEFDARR